MCLQNPTACASMKKWVICGVFYACAAGTMGTGITIHASTRMCAGPLMRAGATMGAGRTIGACETMGDSTTMGSRVLIEAATTMGACATMGHGAKMMGIAKMLPAQWPEVGNDVHRCGDVPCALTQWRAQAQRWTAAKWRAPVQRRGAATETFNSATMGFGQWCELVQWDAPVLPWTMAAGISIHCSSKIRNGTTICAQTKTCPEAVVHTYPMMHADTMIQDVPWCKDAHQTNRTRLSNVAHWCELCPSVGLKLRH